VQAGEKCGKDLIASKFHFFAEKEFFNFDIQGIFIFSTSILEKGLLWLKRRHDIHHNNTKPNYTQYNVLNCDSQLNTFTSV